MSQYTSLNWSAAYQSSPQVKPFVSTKIAKPALLKWSEPARLVTDSLLSKLPVQVLTSTSLKQADAVMDSTRSRYALVMDLDDELVGVLALRDLHGRKAVQKAHELNVAHNELSVDYLMTPIERLPVISQQQLEKAQIGDVVATLQSSGHDFLLVQQQGRLVGLVAALTIVERTGESVQVRHHADSFAELLYVLQHHEDVE